MTINLSIADAARLGLPVAKGRAPRHQPGKMNGLELRYAGRLDELKLLGEVIEYWFESFTLKLADDLRYTPDFVVLMADLSLQAVEVKGFWRDDARAKIKMAARLFPFRFIACQWKKQTGWTFEEF